MENQPNVIWVSFNSSGSICATSTTQPCNLEDDTYGNKWVEMSPTDQCEVIDNENAINTEFTIEISSRSTIVVCNVKDLEQAKEKIENALSSDPDIELSGMEIKCCDSHTYA
jgi:hypothetical protein